MKPPNPYAPPNPAAALPAAQPATTLGQDARCGACGVALPASKVLYDQTGNTLCEGCLNAGEVEASRARSSRTLLGVAYGTPLLGLSGLWFGPLGLAAMAQGLYVLRAVKDPETLKRLESSIGSMKMAAVVGMVLGGLTAIFRFFVAVATSSAG